MHQMLHTPVVPGSAAMAKLIMSKPVVLDSELAKTLRKPHHLFCCSMLDTLGENQGDGLRLQVVGSIINGSHYRPEHAAQLFQAVRVRHHNLQIRHDSNLYVDPGALKQLLLMGRKLVADFGLPVDDMHAHFRVDTTIGDCAQLSLPNMGPPPTLVDHSMFSGYLASRGIPSDVEDVLLGTAHTAGELSSGST